MNHRDAATAVELALHADDEDARWQQVVRLQSMGALAVARQLAQDADPVRRTLAADVLGQLAARAEALEVLLGMIALEQDPEVLASIAIGFGHIGDERCIPWLVRLAGHADADVRHGVAFGLLGSIAPAALETLAELSADPEPHVRDWATFGLARQVDHDDPVLREALAARLDDPDPDTRAEAIHGLARRGDRRAVKPLLDALSGPPLDDYVILHEARSMLAVHDPDGAP